MTAFIKIPNENILISRLSPILKWAGGKEQELKHIHPAMPKEFNKYFEPFIGGGAVYFSIDKPGMFINDKSHELIDLYNAIKTQDNDYFKIVNQMIVGWNKLHGISIENKVNIVDIYQAYSEDTIDEENIRIWINAFLDLNAMEFENMFNTYFQKDLNNYRKELDKNLFSKIKRMKKIENEKGKLPTNDIVDNIESALKSAFYMHIRYLHNHIKELNLNKSQEVAIFFFIRNFAYSGMFRYNKNGHFNVPYGGIGYNNKNLTKKMDYLQSNELIKHLNKTQIENLDFEDFFNLHKPKKDDFIFLDPPYDSEFSTYAKNEFDKKDQERLASYLIENCEAKWMMIIKNTEFIFNLYNKLGINMSTFDKKYMVSFQNRNDRDAKHLIIRNYEG